MSDPRDERPTKLLDARLPVSTIDGQPAVSLGSLSTERSSAPFVARVQRLGGRLAPPPCSQAEKTCLRRDLTFHDHSRCVLPDRREADRTTRMNSAAEPHEVEARKQVELEAAQ
eukprot:1671040-Prymnesium_polylepis.2